MKPAVRTRTYGVAYSFCPNHTDIIETLARARLSGREFRIVLLIMRQTDGYLRAEDQISPAFFAAKTGIQKAHIGNALARLKTWGIISVTQGRPPAYSVKPPGQWAPKSLTENGSPADQDEPKAVNDEP